MIHFQVNKCRLPILFYICYVVQQFYFICPASGYSTFCRASRWQSVVHRGFRAAGQLVTLVYRGKINDLLLCDDNKTKLCLKFSNVHQYSRGLHVQAT